MRCKGCDVLLSDREGTWRKERECFEELCIGCRRTVYTDNEDLIVEDSELNSLDEPVRDDNISEDSYEEE